jgi:hypothetical protein
MDVKCKRDRQMKVLAAYGRSTSQITGRFTISLSSNIVLRYSLRNSRELGSLVLRAQLLKIFSLPNK